MSDKIADGIVAGSVDVSLPVELRLSATSAEKTGVIFSDVTASYWRQGGVRTNIPMATLATVNSAHDDGGFKEVDATNQPGLYRFDVLDAAFASGADWVVITVKVANCFVQHFMFALTSGINVRALSGDAAAADNAEAFFDGTGYAGTNNVIPTVGSVTGAVGSVTGAVGSVTGAVGSVTGAVGSVTGSVGSVVGFTAADVALIKAVTVKIDTGLVVDGAVYQFTANMLELGPAGGGGGSGTGARTVTITVNDGATVLQNALVRMTEGANTFTALTNVSGIAVFNLDDATYTVSVTKYGYTYAGTTIIVNGTETATYSMTLIVLPVTDAPLCNVTIPVRDQYGQPLVGEPVEIRFNQFTDAAETDAVVLSPPTVLESDVDGNVTTDLLRNAEYSVFYGEESYQRRLEVTVPDAGSYTVSE